MRAFHKHSIVKQQIYNNIVDRKTGVGYSPGIILESNIFNMDRAESLTKSNQP